MTIRHRLALPTLIGVLVAVLVPRVLLGAPPSTTHEPSLTLKAKTHNSGFALAHDTYNGLSAASISITSTRRESSFLLRTPDFSRR